MSSRQLSQHAYERLCKVLPGGVNSPVRACLKMGQLPMIVDYGYRDLLTDIDGNTYIDYCGSWGALIHGHANPVILEAVRKRMAKGSSFGITTLLEVEFAEEIIKLVNSIEQIRVVCSGTEATMSAIRLARGFTKRDLIIKFAGHYHGHADFFLVEAGSGVLDNAISASSAGIPAEIVKHTICLPYNDIEACQRIFALRGDRIAAVILEPIAGNMGVVRGEEAFINFLRQETQRHGSLLIFDEVITGFRIAQHGAQGFYSICPDLTCFGKIIGGGFPIAAFGGRKDIMAHLSPIGSVYQAGTLAGNPLGVEAGLQSLYLLQRAGFYEELQYKTDLLLKPIQQAIKQHGWNVCIQHIGSMFTIFFGTTCVRNLDDALKVDRDLFAQFFRFLFALGIYIPPSPYESWFISGAHEESNLQKTQQAILAFMHQTFKT